MNKAQLVWVGASLLGISYSPSRVKEYPGREFVDTYYFRPGLEHHTFTLSDRRKECLHKEKLIQARVNLKKAVDQYKRDNGVYVSNSKRTKINSAILMNNIFYKNFKKETV